MIQTNKRYWPSIDGIKFFKMLLHLAIQMSDKQNTSQAAQIIAHFALCTMPFFQPLRNLRWGIPVFFAVT